MLPGRQKGLEDVGGIQNFASEGAGVWEEQCRGLEQEILAL